MSETEKDTQRSVTGAPAIKRRRSEAGGRYASFLRKLILPSLLKRENRESALKHWKLFEASQYWPRQKLLDYQWEKLRSLLAYAYENCPYYTRVFNERDLTPGSFKSPDDLSLLPILSKDTLYEHMNEILSRQFRKSEMLQFATGGTTGRQVIMYRDSESVNIKQGVAWRHEGWAGRRPCEKMALLWPASADFRPKESFRTRIKGRYLMREVLYRAGSSREEIMRKIYDDIIKFGPRILKVFPSALFRFCEYIEQKNLPALALEGIMSTGEVLYDFQRARFEKTFGCQIFDMYGSREVGNTACGCESHQSLHVAVETQYVEFLDNGVPVDYGQPGEIVVTDLTNFAQPAIRYQINDRGTPLKAHCACGRSLPLMSPVIGRLTDDFWGPDGTRHSGLVLAVHVLTANPDIPQMQIIQKTLTEFHVRITNRPEPSNDMLEFVQSRMKKIIGSEINVTIETVDKLPQERSGKTRFLICEIDRPANGG